MSEEGPTGFKIASAYVEIKASDTGLRPSMASQIKAATEGLDAQVKLQLDGADLRQKVKSEITGASGEGVKVQLGVDGDHLRGEVQAEVEGAGAGEKIKVPVEVDHTGFEAQFRSAMREAEQASEDADQAIRRSFSDIERSSATLRATAADTGDELESAGEKAKESGDRAGSSSGGYSMAAGGMRMAMMAALGLAPALAALPALVGGGALAVGAIGSAFAGVAGALKDHVALTNQVGQSGASMAATEFSNALAIRNANQAIVDAKKNAAVAAVAANQRIIDANQALGDAERQAATATQSSADSVINAQRGVESATYSLTQSRQTETNALYAQRQAQEALTQAQLDAQNTIADLANAAADSHLAVEGAIRNEAAAQQALDASRSGGTAAQQATADYQLRLAKQAVIDAKQRELEATQKSNQANKEGVSGLPAVVNAQHAVAQAADGVAAAQHGVTQALQGQADAQHALTLALQAQVNQQISTAESIARAQRGVSDATKAAADQQVASQQAIQKAVQSLADTQEQQRLSAASAAASGAAASNKFAQDMAKGTPAMRDMVNQLLSMKTGFDQIKATAQSTLLPGFTQMLVDVAPMLGPFNTAVGEMGRVVGGLAAQFGALFRDPAFQDAFIGVLKQGTGLVQQLGTGFIQMFHGLTMGAGQAAPIVDAVGHGFQTLLGMGIPAFFNGLTTGATDSAGGIRALFSIVSDLLGPVGTLAGAFAAALGPALTSIEPLVQQLADQLQKSLLPVMPDLSRALSALVDMFAQLLPIVIPLIPAIATDLSDALKVIAPILRDVAGFLKDNADWLKPVAVGILDLTLGFRALKIATDFGKSGLDLFKNIIKEFSSEGKIATTATKGWQMATSELAGTLGTVVPIVGGIVGGSIALGQWLGSVGDHARDAAAEVNRFTGSIIDISQHAPGASAELDFLSRTAVGMDKSIGGGHAALLDVDTALAQLVASGHADQAAAAMDSMTKSVKAGGGSVDDLRKLLPKYQDALGQASNETRQAGLDAKNAQTPFQGLALRLTDTAQAGKNSAGELSHVDTALTNLDKQLASQQALDDFNKALNDMKDGAAGSSKSIDGNTQSAMDNRRQLEESVTAARHFYDAQIANHVSVDQANASFQAQVDALRTQAEKTYGSKKAVDDFLVSLGLIRPDYTTTLKVSDAEGRAVISSFQKVLDSLKLVNVSLLVDQITGTNGITVLGTNVKARAAGGPVKPGETYVVGERGQEIFQPTQPGYIYPHGQKPPAPVVVTPPAPPVQPKQITNNFNYYGPQHPSPETQAIMKRQMATAAIG